MPGNSLASLLVMRPFAENTVIRITTRMTMRLGCRKKAWHCAVAAIERRPASIIGHAPAASSVNAPPINHLLSGGVESATLETFTVAVCAVTTLIYGKVGIGAVSEASPVQNCRFKIMHKWVITETQSSKHWLGGALT